MGKGVLGDGRLTRRVVVILDSPRILVLALIRLLKPLDRLISILTRPDKRDNPLRVMPSSLINRLKKDIIQAIDNSTVFRRGARDLVNRFKRNHVALTGQLCANLLPQLTQPLFHKRYVGAGLREIGPRPRVVVHVYYRVHTACGHHVDDIGDALEPCGIHGPVRGLGGEVVGPGHWYTDAFETGSFDIVKGAADDGGIVPVAFVFDGVERVANVPAGVQFRKVGPRRDGGEFRGRGTSYACAICCWF